MGYGFAGGVFGLVVGLRFDGVGSVFVVDGGRVLCGLGLADLDRFDINGFRGWQ